MNTILFYDYELPKKAFGCHKVNKVMILRSSEGFDYAIVLLDQNIVVKFIPEHDGFSKETALVLLSEGEEIYFKKAEVPNEVPNYEEQLAFPEIDQNETISEDEPLVDDKPGIVTYLNLVAH